MRGRRFGWFLTVAAVGLVTGFFVRPAEAGGLKATMYLTQAKIPGGLTEAKLLGFARANSMKLLHETHPLGGVERGDLVPGGKIEYRRHGTSVREQAFHIK